MRYARCVRNNVIQKIKSAPHQPGVYIFYQNQSPIYVGKALDLKKRLVSYLKIQDWKTQTLDQETTQLEYHILRSDIEALIEESKLIKKYSPKYNTLLKDDKNYLYVGFTKKPIQKIFITHQIKLKQKFRSAQPQEFIGPFTESSTLRQVLKILRKQFPYCTCYQNHLRDCLNYQIGLCYGFCCHKNFNKDQLVGKITDREAMSLITEQLRLYQKNIRIIKSFLLGKKLRIGKILTKLELETVERILEHKNVVSLEKLSRNIIKNNSHNKILGPEVRRVECYDNAHLGGDLAYGAMTVFEKEQSGQFVKNTKEYRLFKIKSAPNNDDPRMIYEVLSRRIVHLEWSYPQFIIIDGGKTQLAAAQEALGQFPNLKTKIKIISFAKKSRVVYCENRHYALNSLAQNEQELILQAIFNTHRYVTRAHIRAREKSFLHNKSY